MAITKAKIAVVFVVAILLMGTGIGIVLREVLMAPAEPNAPALAEAAPSATQTFAQVYGLQRNEVIRQVLPPYIPARLDFYRKQQEGPEPSANQIGQEALVHSVAGWEVPIVGTEWRSCLFSELSDHDAVEGCLLPGLGRGHIAGRREYRGRYCCQTRRRATSKYALPWKT